jgi:Cytochrome c554 and c-prime
MHRFFQALRLRSAYWLAILVFAWGLPYRTVLAQVPGICTQPDGASWPMNTQPNAGAAHLRQLPLPATSGNQTLPTKTNHFDAEAMRSFLSQPNVQPNLEPNPGSHPGSKPIVNRYAPHSIHSQTSSTPFNTSGPSPTSSSPSRTTIHSVSNRFANRRDNDDLLAPLPSAKTKNDSDDLLGPPSVPNAAVDPLSNLGPDAAKEQQRQENKVPAPANGQLAIDPHQEVFANEQYPSALTCAKCHKKIYDEWRVSGHAYSAVSPMFQRFEQAVADLVRGTSGTFCVRCHAPVATQSDYPREAPIFSGPAVFREGITCIACHRVVERYGRVNGERRMETGSPYDPVVGSWGGDGIAAVIADADNYKVKTDPNDKRPLQAIHRGAIKFEQLSDSSFCAGCHQVLVQPGIALEVVYQQYRSGPACKKGISCQDCHMGAVPGKPDGYAIGAAAEVNGKSINTNRKHANHIFHGPSYPLAHPGIFPHNEKSLRWTAEQWLEFDHREGWGTEAFENAVSRGQLASTFPPAWSSAQERRDARKVVDENQNLIAIKRDSATQTLENGGRIDGPFFDTAARVGTDLKFHYVVSNTSEGHNMPSGSLGAQPQLWLNAVLIGPDGAHLWESGHLDTNGDLCDWHSLDVRANRFHRDNQLANFQTKFLITNVKGTEREMYLPVPVDIDPLPFFRPGVVPYTVLNHPPFIRMEAHSVPPLDSRTVHYAIPSKLLCQPGKYRLSVRLRSRVEPAYFLLFCKGTPDMQRSLNEGIIDVHPYSTEFMVR